MELPDIGEHCSEKSCNRLDFLPLKCDACESIFCRDHVTYNQHDCPSAYKKDVQVPVCPLCNAPVPTKRGDPPDLAVGQHIDNECQSDIGKSRRKVFTNKCSYKGCKIREVVQVNCDQCKDNYCLKHRHPQDHACVGREEAMRQKRLQAVQQKNSPTNGSDRNTFGSIQGYMSEDEALARALQASLNETSQNRRQALQPVPSSSTRDRCMLS